MIGKVKEGAPCEDQPDFVPSRQTQSGLERDGHVVLSEAVACGAAERRPDRLTVDLNVDLSGGAGLILVVTVGPQSGEGEKVDAG